MSALWVCYAPTLLRKLHWPVMKIHFAMLCLMTLGGSAEFALQTNILLQHLGFSLKDVTALQGAKQHDA